eukprot:2852181-Rhodomonas_salina.1
MRLKQPMQLRQLMRQPTRLGQPQQRSLLRMPSTPGWLTSSYISRLLLYRPMLALGPSGSF